MIRIDALWLSTEPLDMRCGTEAALARVEIQEALGLAAIVAVEFEGVQAVIEGLLLALQGNGQFMRSARRQAQPCGRCLTKALARWMT